MKIVQIFTLLAVAGGAFGTLSAAAQSADSTPATTQSAQKPLDATQTGSAISASTAALPSSGTPWSLNDCLSFALSNNIDVQQRSLTVEQRDLDLSTSQYSRLPNLSASVGYNATFGRGTGDNNVRETGTIQTGSLDIGANMPLFQGFRINREVKGGKLDLAAAVQDLERVREDLSIKVMTLYLQVLYNKELTEVAERQLQLSSQQAARSRELVTAGKQSESARYESEALEANDQLSLTQARNDLQLSLLDLSQELNRESAAGFDVVMPELDSITLASLHLLGTADDVYAYAAEYRPHIKAERLRLESSENAIRIARADLYPSLTLNGGFGTGLYSTMDSAFGTQFRKNSSEFVGISMNIPIFNRRATRNKINGAKVSYQSQQLAVIQAELSLRKEIEQAWYNADAAYSKYRSAEVALASAKVAFRYEQQKADAGRSTIFDFNDAKTRMQKAESELVQSKYEFVFRSKILDYYRGKPLTL